MNSRLKKIFKENTKVPIWVLGIIILIIQVSLFINTFVSNSINQEKSILNLIEIANLSIEQKNRPVLETTFSVALDELKASSVLLCRNGREVLNLPHGISSCEKPPEGDFFTKIIQLSPKGRSDYRYFFSVPTFLVSHEIAISFILTFVFFILALFILDYLLKKDKKDQLIRSKQDAANAIIESKIKISHNIKSYILSLESLRDSVQKNLPDAKLKTFNDLVRDTSNLVATLNKDIPSKNTSAFITDESFFQHMQNINKQQGSFDPVNVTKSVINRINASAKNKGARFNAILSSNCKDFANFIYAVETEYRSIISNLINNAKEAGAQKCWITIDSKDDFIFLKVRNDGALIDDNNRKFIFNRGATYQKKDGTGYGLFHARQFINSWNGEIYLDEEFDETCFSITIPKWRPKPINFSPFEKVILVDDDPTVLSLTQNKLSSLMASESLEFQIISFSDTVQLHDYLSSAEIDYSSTLFLVDNDLGENMETGSEIINSLGIQEISYLLTNSYDDSKLIKYCKTSNIEIFPKPLFLNS